MQYPDSLSTVLVENESFSVSGIYNKGQGADFVHEEKNKLIKSFLPPGVPYSEVWQRVSRKCEELKSLKEMSISSYSSSVSRRPRLDNEELMMRREIRGYLMKSSLNVHSSTCMDGESLDPILHNIKQTGRDNYATYKAHLAESGQFGGVKLDPVFLTKINRDEFSKIENKTKDEIRTMINALISLMPDVSVQSLFRSLIPKPGKNKVVFVEFYSDVSNELQEQLANETIQDEAEQVIDV
ncbi:unnamed protein product [Mytilus coruscus]|uniref:Uncharacterized protein n=1 Tax=Mytilus coruscus TaxID=42192 RepID=A0A6J8ECM3_MYTCO|nr:unnamed protein product [Mytilus coruscus]